MPNEMIEKENLKKIDIDKVVIIEFGKNYDIIVEDLLDIGSLINEEIDKWKDILLIYDHFYDKNDQRYDGLEDVFKIDGLVSIINDYFTRRKIGLKAKIYLLYINNRLYNFIKIEKFIRLEGVSTIKMKINGSDKIIEEETREKDEIRIKRITDERNVIREG